MEMVVVTNRSKELRRRGGADASTCRPALHVKPNRFGTPTLRPRATNGTTNPTTMSRWILRYVLAMSRQVDHRWLNPLMDTATTVTDERLGAKMGVQSLVSAKGLGTYSCPPPQHHQPTRVDDGAVRVGGKSRKMYIPLQQISRACDVNETLSERYTDYEQL